MLDIRRHPSDEAFPATAAHCVRFLRAEDAFTVVPRRADRIMPDSDTTIASSQMGHRLGVTARGAVVKPRPAPMAASKTCEFGAGFIVEG